MIDATALLKVAYGVYIVSSADGEHMGAYIANTAFQVTAEPPQFAIACHKNNQTTDIIRSSENFCINLVQKDVDLRFIGKFGFRSGLDTNKFENTNFRIGPSGAPIMLDKTVAYIDCEVVDKVDVGTHWLIVGRVLEAQILVPDTDALDYEHYRTVIRGLSPKNAPTYINPEKLQAN